MDKCRAAHHVPSRCPVGKAGRTACSQNVASGDSSSLLSSHFDVTQTNSGAHRWSLEHHTVNKNTKACQKSRMIKIYTSLEQQ